MNDIIRGDLLLYLIAVVLGVLLGIIMKGRIKNIMNIKFQKIGIILSAFVIQITRQILSFKGVSFAVEYGFWIQGGVFLLMFIGFWFNRRYLGICIVGCGCFLNALVMMINGGKMPVSIDALVNANLMDTLDLLKAGTDGKHIIISSGTKLTFLSDVIYIPGFIGAGMPIVSIGDLFIVAGIFILALMATMNNSSNLKWLILRNGGSQNEKID